MVGGDTPGDGRPNSNREGSTGPAESQATPHFRLITQPRNPFSEKVARALALKNVDFERVLVSEPHEIEAYNPETRLLPVLEYAGERRAESGQILYWLDELIPDPPLLSPDSKVAEAQRSLAEWSDSSFAYYWNRWLASQEPADDESESTESRFLDRMRSSLGRSLGRSSTTTRSDALVLQVTDGIERRLGDLDTLLGDRDYFHADQPSMADLAVLGMLLLIQQGPIPGTADMLAARPSLVAYFERVESVTGGPTVVAA